MSFDPWSHSLKTQDLNLQNGSPFGSAWVHSLNTPLHYQEWICDYQVAFLARTFLCLCFGHEKMTTRFLIKKNFYMQMNFWM
jgi:hypothetical protein